MWFAILNKKVIGCYLLSENSILKYQDYSKENLSKYENKKGVEGVVLALLPEYRKLGIGNDLRNLPEKLGYDYVFGEQLHELNNLSNWIKHGRRLIADTGEVYITLKDLKDNGPITYLK